MRENDNKTKLFNYLADRITQMVTLNVVIVTRTMAQSATTLSTSIGWLLVVMKKPTQESLSMPEMQ